MAVCARSPRNLKLVDALVSLMDIPQRLQYIDCDIYVLNFIYVSIHFNCSVLHVADSVSFLFPFLIHDLIEISYYLNYFNKINSVKNH